jgi:hypothetical protein
MIIEYAKILSPPMCRRYPEKIWVYGDNLKHFGKGGQAIIRDEPNAFGIPTKRYPSWDDWAFFSDKPDELEAVKVSLRELWKLGQDKVIVFPEDGIGTGRAKMKEKSPVAYEMMCGILWEHFGIVNGEKVWMR